MSNTSVFDQSHAPAGKPKVESFVTFIIDKARKQRPKLGRPIAVSKSAIPGTALVGAFSTAAQLFRRTGLLIEMTNCNDDDFVRNLITIRAELRAALAVYAGATFCEVTGLP